MKKGSENLWLIGDSFVNASVRSYLPVGQNQEAFIMENFEVAIVAGSEKSSCKNILARIINGIVNTFNTQITIPKWVVIILEDDILKTVKPETIEEMKKLFTFLMTNIQEQMDRATKGIPLKANKYAWPNFLFLEPSLHRSYQNNDRRKLAILALHQAVADFNRIIVLPIKQEWCPVSRELYNNNRGAISHIGLKAFWRGLDATIRFADTKLMRNFGIPLSAIFRKEHIAKESAERMTDFEVRRTSEDLRWQLQSNHQPTGRPNYHHSRRYQQERFNTQIQRKNAIKNDNLSSKKRLF